MRRPLTLQVTQALEQGILDGRWPSGSKLPTEDQLLSEFRVSRTVVREALSRLNAAGRVVTQHGVGTFVVGPEQVCQFRVRADQVATLDDVLSLLELRVAIETEIAGLAALRRSESQLSSLSAALDAFDAAVLVHQDALEPDLQFHLLLADAAYNSHLIALMRSLEANLIPRSRLQCETPNSPDVERYLKLVNLEHRDILDAVVQGSETAARCAMRAHLTNAIARRYSSIVMSSDS